GRFCAADDAGRALPPTDACRLTLAVAPGHRRWRGRRRCERGPGGGGSGSFLTAIASRRAHRLAHTLLSAGIGLDDRCNEALVATSGAAVGRREHVAVVAVGDLSITYHLWRCNRLLVSASVATIVGRLTTTRRFALGRCRGTSAARVESSRRSTSFIRVGRVGLASLPVVFIVSVDDQVYRSRER